jgi:enoyl-CoA hydratase
MTAFDSLQNVRVEVRDGVAFVTVNRPKALNALNDATHDDLLTAFEAIRDDAGIDAAVLTGEGDKAFVAGADITELADMTPMQAKAASAKGQNVFSTIERCGKPVVAALNGFALGGGLELALACHVRLASEHAKLGLPEVTLGLIPGYGGTQRLARLIGVGRALTMTLTGDMIDAATAERYGLVHQVLPADELLAAAEKLARRIASRGPVAIRLVTEAIVDGAGMGLDDGLRLEQDLFGLAFSTEDMREGTQAFLEKRRAEFKGV